MNNQSLYSKKEDYMGSSILSAMDRFVNAVKVMDDTVMVPCRLLDMTPPTDEKPLVPISSDNITNLYSFYTLLNAIKNELVRGPTTVSEDELDNDQLDDKARAAAFLFRQHLTGLFNVLHQMTESANFLTKRYQEEIEDLQRATTIVKR